jgi:hypothetical protein
MPVGVIQAAAASLRIVHDAQDARRIRLQHINNNHSNVTAKHSQTPCPALPRASEHVSTPAERSGELAHQHGRVATGSAKHREVAAARGRVHGDNMRVVGQVIGVNDTQPLAVALQDRDQAAFRRHIQAASAPVEGQNVGLDAHNGGPVTRQVFMLSVSRAELTSQAMKASRAGLSSARLWSFSHPGSGTRRMTERVAGSMTASWLRSCTSTRMWPEAGS